MKRVILHSDLNCYYASVEMNEHPELKGKKVAVCGSTENRHGIVLTASYPAKRCGVKTGMANWQARQACPDLIAVDPHYDLYLKYSKIVRNIYRRFSETIEPFGMDESWISLPFTDDVEGIGYKTAEKIRHIVFDETGLTVSVGVSFSKIFAKLGSDMKKPDAVTVISQNCYKEKVWPLPVSDLLYVGPATTRKLAKYCIHTIGDLANADPLLMKNWFGKNGVMLWNFANGTEAAEVMPEDYVMPVKSVGHGTTCVRDLNNNYEVWLVLYELAQDVGHRLKVHELAAKAVEITVRDNELGWRQWQVQLPYPTQSPLEIATAGYDLFHARYDWNRPKEAIITYEGVVCNEILYGCYAFVKFTGDNEIHDEAGLIETPEPGAVFKVYLKKAGSFDAARVFEKDTITTDEYGKAATKLLPYGIYTVQQTKAKEGYAIKAPFDIFIRGTESPDNPPSMILNNEAIRYRLKFIKVDAETGKTITLANTAFKLKDANGEYVKQTVHYPRTQEIDTFKTDADGTVTLPETVRYGLYFIEEFTAPEGYLIQTNELAVFVGDENMNQPGEAYLLEFEIEDAPVMGQIRLEKTGLQLIGFKEKEDRYGNTVMQPIYEEKRLAGATFEVHASEDIVGKEGTIWYHADELVDTITTTKEGPDLSKTLPLGRYYLVEVSAPEGFTFDDRHYEANLIYSDDHTSLVETVVTAGNTFIPSEISLKKEKEVLQLVRDGELIKQTITEAPGEGFVFGLYNDTDIHYEGGTLMADTLVSVGATDKDGSLTFAGYYPHGRYYIKELSAPVGWKINTDKFMVVLDPHTADEDHVIRATLPETVHDELIWYPVTLTKLDITGEKTLPGALIEVTNDKGEVIYRAYTDQNGQIPNIPVTPGSYHFREVLAPSGYALNEAVMSFTVDEHGGITGDSSIRDDYTRVLLMKKDENGLPLAGVEFSLVKSNGAVLMRKSSDADGKIAFEKIPYGEYTITESKALAGYQKHEISIKLSVDGTYVNKEEPLETIINYPIIVKLKKVDQDNKPLPGAEYALINEFGEQTITAVSDADGMCYTQMFNLLCEKADDVYGGRLPIHVRCLIDEMANIGQIPNLEKLIATIRSREISACLILQAQAQLKAIYKDNADTIVGNCDSVLFLGGKERTTLKNLLISGIMGNLNGLFSGVNEKVSEVAGQVGSTPQSWNSGVFNMVKNLSENVVIPIAGIILTFVMTYELIQMVIDKNSFHDFETFTFFKWVFKTFAATLIVTNTWNIIMGVFDVAQHVVNQASGIIVSDTNLDITAVIANMEARLQAMDAGTLFLLWFQTLLVGIISRILSVCIFLIVYGRMLEIYLMASLGPIPLATMANREWGSMGQNYLRSLLALAFQAFLIIVCVAIYSVLVHTIAVDGDIIASIWTCVGYTVLLCFTLFKTSSLSKAIFSAH